MKQNLIKSLILFCLVLTIVAVGGTIFQDYSQTEDALQVVSEKRLIPGGQSVGIKMNVKGVLVVGLEEIETNVSVESPGYDSGLQIGDKILSVDGKEVLYAQDVTDIVADSEKKVHIVASRNGKEFEIDVQPAKEYASGDYKLGIWVKEKIAGIGTLSFYDPDNEIFGCLGHGIYESKTGTLLEAKDGQLLWTEVKSIEGGISGKPGEIRGVFYNNSKPIGSVHRNCQFGIFARANKIDEDKLGEPIPILYKENVKRGDAYILTTIDGTNVEKFSVKIIGTDVNNEDNTKGIELEVTDEKLIDRSGGIVQGMSGSPIIQDGKLVGAVTHVLVNDPTRGYGIFIENMLETAE